MRDSVSKAFKAFSTKFEGYLTFMYGDVKNLVTTGMGNLIDPIGQALSLPWVSSDGSPASQQQITDAWNAVKARTDLTQKGGGAYKSVTTIRLTEAGIDQLIQKRLASNESTIRSHYPGYDNWPADAQLAIHSMAWAMGPAFNFPKFKADVNKDPPDFTAAATDGQMNATGNPGLVPRNTANKKLFENAAAVLTNKADPDKLYYPGDVPATTPTTTTHPPTTTTHHATTTTHPPTTTTHPPAATTHPPTTTAAPAPATTAAPAPTTTVAPAPTPTTTTAPAPADNTTQAPADSTTAAPSDDTTSAPAGDPMSTPSIVSTSGPDAATTAAPAGAIPTVEATISIDPDPGTSTNPKSIQCDLNAKLKLKWSSTGADTVDINLLGTGLATSGEQDIPTQDANYALVAHGAGGDSDPFNIEVHTNDPGAVVSQHIDLTAGIAAVMSFVATKDNETITQASVGDNIKLLATFSDATETAKINGADAELEETSDGQKQATVDVAIDASSDGNFTCQALKDGAVAQELSQHIDIIPLPGTTTTAAPATESTQAPASSSSAPTPATTTTQAPAPTTTKPAPTTTKPAPTTTHAPPTTTHAPTTTTHAPTTTTHPPTTTTISAAKLSGADWVKQFPTSKTVDSLKTAFKDSVNKFLQALRDAGASILIDATHRPPERGYLMHWAWMISKENGDPQKVPAQTGVDIVWAHKKSDGSYDSAASVKAAAAMNSAYATKYRPSLTSRHFEARAIDMTISWKGTLTIKDASGKKVTISSTPTSGLNSDLQAVGATYGVHKLKSDPPHWSDDGH